MRKSPRELERELEGIETADPPVAGLITVLSAQRAGRDVSTVPGRPGHVAIDGQVKRMTENARKRLLVGGRP